MKVRTTRAFENLLSLLLIEKKRVMDVPMCDVFLDDEDGWEGTVNIFGFVKCNLQG